MNDTEFMTAKEKELVLKKWSTFLKHGCQEKNFTKSLYQHLINHCSFIAHYDRGGFYSTYFTTPEDREHFLSQFTGARQSIEYGYCGWVTDERYSDINSAMCEVAEKYVTELNQSGMEYARTRDKEITRKMLNKIGRPELAQQI